MCVVCAYQVKDSDTEDDCVAPLDGVNVAIDAGPVLIIAEQFGLWLHGVEEIPLSIQLPHACVMSVGYG